MTRNTLYRNFYDPYAREWQQGNSRWDLIDLARMTYALRPERVEWPLHDDGRTSFRLEDLAAANDIGHESAHDVLSDVHATIGLGRLIRDQQPRLYAWLFQLRNKRRVAEQLDLVGREPVLHTSRMYPSEFGCTTLIMPLVGEPGNNNSVLVYDLRQDPRPFMELDQDGLRDRLFTRAEDLPEGLERLPVKSVKINKCPALAPQNTLDEAAIERIAIDLDACAWHWELLCANHDFMQRVAQAYTSREFSPAEDFDLALYEGFLNEADRPLLANVRDTSPQELAKAHFDFHDKRLPELLFRYRARNWPETLSTEEAQRWEQFRRRRVHDEDGGGSITLEQYAEQIVMLRDEYQGDMTAQRVLDDVEAWGRLCVEIARHSNRPRRL